jgi:hypothetical protein
LADFLNRAFLDAVVKYNSMMIMTGASYGVIADERRFGDVYSHIDAALLFLKVRFS